MRASQKFITFITFINFITFAIFNPTLNTRHCHTVRHAVPDGVGPSH